MVPVP
jgi:hypothetical protein